MDAKQVIDALAIKSSETDNFNIKNSRHKRFFAALILWKESATHAQ